METSWIDTVVFFLIGSSALMLVLGAVSFLVLTAFGVREKPRLWICCLVLLMPLAFPLRSLLPTQVRIPLPRETLSSVSSLPLDTGSKKTASEIAPPAVAPTDLYSTEAPVTDDEKRNIPHNIVSVTGQSNPWDLKTVAVFLWIGLFLFFLIRLCIAAERIRALIRSSNPVSDARVLRLLEQCATATGLSRPPRLRTVPELPSPMMIGFFRPVILLPVRLLSPELREGLNFVLLHELKHLKRRDNWWLLVEAFVAAAYFFHPAIYWAKKKIHEDLEDICDAHVIRVTGQLAPYADFLLNEIWRQGRRQKYAMALPFISAKSKTKNRIQSILKKRRQSMFTKIRGRFAVGLVSLVFASLLLCTVGPAAQEQEETLDRENASPTETPGVYQLGMVMDRIENVKIFYKKGMAPSDEENEPIELSPDQWSFDTGSGRLVIDADVDDTKQVVFVFGKQAIPWQWHFDMAIQEGSVTLLLEDRDGVRGEDFDADEAEGRVWMLKPELCTEDTQYYFSFGIEPDPDQAPGMNGSVSFGNMDFGWPEPDEEQTPEVLENTSYGAAYDIGIPQTYGMPRPVEDFGIKVSLSKLGEYDPRDTIWLEKNTDFTYDESTGRITLKDPIPEGYNTKYVFVGGVPMDKLMMNRSILPGSVEMYLNPGCYNEIRLAEETDYEVDYETGTVSLLNPLLLEKDAIYRVNYTDLNGRSDSYGGMCNPERPEDYDRSTDYDQAVPCTAVVLQLPRTFATVQILQEKGLWAYVVSDDNPNRPINLKRGEDYVYDTQTGILSLLGDIDIDGMAGNIVVTGIPEKRNEFNFHQPIDPAGLEVRVAGMLLEQGKDYTVDTDTGILLVTAEEILDPYSLFSIRFGDVTYGNQTMFANDN